MTNHPAQYTNRILELMQELATGITGIALDPFAGVGNIHKIAHDKLRTVGVELEEEWAGQHPDTIRGDATRLPFPQHAFDAVFTSPVYGNRMSDCHNATERCKRCLGNGCDNCDQKGRNEYKRLTYTHRLGRKLTEGNAGAMQWGKQYRDLHGKAWQEAVRVLKPKGIFVLNISDHIRKGLVMPVTAFHTATLAQLGIEWKYRIPVETPRMRYGQNHELRVGHEDIYVGVKT